MEERLAAPQAKAGVSVAKMSRYWYVACRSKDLAAGATMPVTILGTPMVVFRNQRGEVGALLDRCPHRNVPLSIGRVCGSTLQCSYHGWEFSPQGACVKIPGYHGEADTRGHRATSFPVRDQQGYVWVFASSDVEPDVEPFWLPFQDDPAYSHVHRRVEAPGTLHQTIENALDVPHTAFLHKGLFRGTGERNDIKALVRRFSDHVECQYIGEPRPQGIAARILSPSGGEVTHFDRFFLPSVAQVDYSLGEDSHVLVTSLCTPVTDFHTVIFAAVSLRVKHVPSWAIKTVMDPVGRMIFAQDAKVLGMQTEAIRRFGGEQFVSTDIDLLGPHIWRLMKAAERGDVGSGDGDVPTFEKTVELTV